MFQWSSGRKFASGARGPGFDSPAHGDNFRIRAAQICSAVNFGVRRSQLFIRSTYNTGNYRTFEIEIRT